MKLESKVKAVKQEPSYGHINLSSSSMPEVKDLKIGSTISLTIDVEIKSLRAPDQWEISNEGKKPGDITAGLNIKAVKFPGKKDNK